jgi:hypothetical protein
LSSSVNEGPFESLLRRSLSMLEREAPALYPRLCESFQGSRVYALVDAESLLIGGDHGRITLSPGVVRPPALPETAIAVRSSMATIAALFEGELSLLDVVLSDQVHLLGALTQLLVVHEALGIYLRAAVRCTSAPALLAELQLLRGEVTGEEQAA